MSETSQHSILLASPLQFSSQPETGPPITRPGTWITGPATPDSPAAAGPPPAEGPCSEMQSTRIYKVAFSSSNSNGSPPFPSSAPAEQSDSPSGGVRPAISWLLCCSSGDAPNTCRPSCPRARTVCATSSPSAAASCPHRKSRATEGQTLCRMT